MRMGCRSSEKPKINYKKGLWSPEEDQRLKDYILKHDHGCWSAVPIKAGLERNGKSCRLRWINYLRPGLKRGVFSQEEEEIVMKLHAVLGNKWSQIAMHLPGRTDNEVKNYWNTHLKKRVTKSEAPDSAKLSEAPSLDSSAQYHKIKEGTLNKISLFDMFEPSESSSHSHGCSQEKLQSSWPKVMFADWLFGENADCQLSLESPNGGKSLTWDTSRETLSNGDLRAMFQQEFGDSGSYVSYFEPVDLMGSGSFDLLSFGGNCGGFEMNQDLMF